MLVEREKETELPTLRDRLPEDPVVTVPFEKVGTYGGTARVFFTDYDKINAAENGLTVDPTASKIFPNTSSPGPLVMTPGPLLLNYALA